MQKDFDVNPAHEAWKSSTESEKEQSLQILIRRMERFATAICCQKLSDHSEEFGPLVNGIVWRAVKHMDKFQEGSKFSTWFYRIAANECNRFLRNIKERCETSLEEEMPTNQAGLDARVDLIALLDGLEGEEHLLFKMVAEGQDFNAIAEALGIKRNAAIQRWDRLKRKLRNAI